MFCAAESRLESIQVDRYSSLAGKRCVAHNTCYSKPKSEHVQTLLEAFQRC